MNFDKSYGVEMDFPRKVEQIQRYIGSKLLLYTLNIDSEDAFSPRQYEFSIEQKKVINTIIINIQEYRRMNIEEGNIGDDISHFLRGWASDNSGLFNKFREICYGEIASYKSEDKLLNFIFHICVREYPNLLLLDSTNYFNHRLEMNVSYEERQEFSKLVCSDVLNSLTNKKEGLEFCFSFDTESGVSVDEQVFCSLEILIKRAFQNSTNRMSYSLGDVIKELENNIVMLRELAKGRRVEYSTFVGIKGLYFDGFTQYKVSNAIFRQIDSTKNPGINVRSAATMHSRAGGSSVLGGQILEVIHETNLRNIDLDTRLTSAGDIIDRQDEVIDPFKLAVVFALKKDRGFAIGMRESGFALSNPGNFSQNPESPSIYQNINARDIESVKDWYEHLHKIDLTSIKVPLKRIKFAIFERKKAEDAIVDAVIAWEGLFSSAYETTFKVSSSIAKYIYPVEQRSQKYKRIKTLYGYRSALVHGGYNKNLHKENLDELRGEVIDIGLKCIMKMLKDPQLLSLTSSERVEKILLL